MIEIRAKKCNCGKTLQVTRESSQDVTTNLAWTNCYPLGRLQEHGLDVFKDPAGCDWSVRCQFCLKRNLIKSFKA